MGKSRTVPLARGLIGGEVGSIYGQLEIFLINNSRIKILIRRKPYSGRPDIKFSMACPNLQDFIDILQDANEQLDVQWLSRVALAELKDT
ncbi:MAG: hypothetical protein JSV05_07775 [Candidatus Bathyarchaeota archaeon]|nr:MAG: hypothetical protein JSV05_07775 [Candidatus Bathyarchaeota archaeon]